MSAIEPRPIAIDTSLLFPMIRSAVHQAECRMIDSKRCFVVSEAVFLQIMSYFFATAQNIRFDPRIAEEGYDNIEVSLSARDKHIYYLCAKVDPFFDTLWAKKGPKEG